MWMGNSYIAIAYPVLAGDLVNGMRYRENDGEYGRWNIYCP